MKAALFLLSLCLLITFSRKRAVNPYQFIADKSNIQIRIAEDDRSDAHGIGRGSVLLKRIFMLALTDDDGFRSLRSRQILSGLPGCFHAITVNMYSRVNTEDYFNEIYTDLPSHLFNKGSPENESIRITYFITNFKSSDCLFRLLHQYYTFPLLFSKTTSSLLICSQYPAIIQLQPLFLSRKMRLHVSKRYTFYKKRLGVLSDLAVFKKIRPPPLYQYNLLCLYSNIRHSRNCFFF